jgi:protein-tyrosine phosphatase
MDGDRIRILFICLGNICRSPLAESVFRHLARERGVDHLFEIDSAGTSGYHAGDPPDARSVATARRRGVVVEGVSRKIAPEDLARFHHVVVMDGENLASVERMRPHGSGRARISRLRDWDPHEPGSDVPDPYYGGVRGFDDVHDIVERACARLLDELVEDLRE